MPDDPHARAEWKIRPVAFLLPHLEGEPAETSSAVNAVLMAPATAHSEGLRYGASVCREVGTNARRHGEVAAALAGGIEAMAARNDTEAAEDVMQCRSTHDGPGI